MNPICRAGEVLKSTSILKAPPLGGGLSQEERVLITLARCDEAYARFRSLISDAVLKDAGGLASNITVFIRPDIPPPLDGFGNPLPPPTRVGN